MGNVSVDVPPKMEGVKSLQINDLTHEVTGLIHGQRCILGYVVKWYARDAVNDGVKMFRAEPLAHLADSRDFEHYGQASEYLVDYWADITMRTY
jgi:hypothetical protein